MATFSDALNRWLATRSLTTKPATQRFYRFVAATIRENWTDMSISPDAIDFDMLLTFTQRVKHVSPSMWNSIVAALQFITPQAKDFKRRRMKSRHFSPPSQQQFDALLAACDRAPRSRAGLIVRFLSFTGLRISEAMALTWLNVFADRIEVPGEVTKSGKSRVIPLLPGITDTLTRLRALDSAGFVLPRQSARKAIETATLKVTGVRWSHHSFRHLYATRCIQSGVDMPTVARWLGHQDGGALLARTYYHLVDSHSQRMAALVRI